jgi:hypothetical protein
MPRRGIARLDAFIFHVMHAGSRRMSSSNLKKEFLFENCSNPFAFVPEGGKEIRTAMRFAVQIGKL